jgi:hypothetical protein
MSHCLFNLSSLSHYTVKKRLVVFPSPAGLSLTKLSLAGKTGDGKTANLFSKV